MGGRRYRVAAQAVWDAVKGQSYSRQVLTVFEDPERAQQMSVRARALIERKYRWETVLDAVFAL